MTMWSDVWVPLTVTPTPHISDRLIVGPACEPIDLDEVKRHIRFTATTAEDTLIDTYIAMARQYFETETDRQLITATWERQFDAFPDGVIELPHPPLIDVVSVAYDVEGSPSETLLTEDVDYVVDAPSGPQATRGVVRTVAGASWPTAIDRVGSVRVRYRAGYGDHPGDVPELVKGALYFLVGHFHRFREDIQDATTTLAALPIGATAIMRSFKYTALPIYPARRVS